jgi:hypothetical protein
LGAGRPGLEDVCDGDCTVGARPLAAAGLLAPVVSVDAVVVVKCLGGVPPKNAGVLPESVVTLGVWLPGATPALLEAVLDEPGVDPAEPPLVTAADVDVAVRLVAVLPGDVEVADPLPVGLPGAPGVAAELVEPLEPSVVEPAEFVVLLLLPVECGGGPPVWEVSAWATPNPPASAAPTPSVSAPALSHA